MTAAMINIVLPSSDPGAIKYMQEQLDEVYNIYVVFGKVKTKLKSIAVIVKRESIEEGEAKNDTDTETMNKEISISTPEGGPEREREECEVETYFLRLSSQIYLDNAHFESLVILVPQLLAEYSFDRADK